MKKSAILLIIILLFSCHQNDSGPQEDIKSIGHIAFFLLDLPEDENDCVMEQADFMHYYGQLISWLNDEKQFDVSTHFSSPFLIALPSGKQLSFSEESFKIKEGIVFVKNSGEYKIVKDTHENHVGLIKEIEKYFGVNLTVS